MRTVWGFSGCYVFLVLSQTCYGICSGLLQPNLLLFTHIWAMIPMWTAHETHFFSMINSRTKQLEYFCLLLLEVCSIDVGFTIYWLFSRELFVVDCCSFTQQLAFGQIENDTSWMMYETWCTPQTLLVTSLWWSHFASLRMVKIGENIKQTASTTILANI